MRRQGDAVTGKISDGSIPEVVCVHHISQRSDAEGKCFIHTIQVRLQIEHHETKCETIESHYQYKRQCKQLDHYLRTSDFSNYAGDDRLHIIMLSEGQVHASSPPFVLLLLPRKQFLTRTNNE